ncbi:30S ribosomal protein S12 methylthiotransferase RimO [Merdimmobilis hominis]|uniref:Ribosomal protein uS12 methylthiotransferase RimO n=2 Tax=Oscillospiraceae TaxID=216572 RepID=A0A6N2R1U8_9FIRM|nr:30S ribosomal protein S12 methylthiotransferase RimO [Merdimmobilis hominis]MCD4836797.1 30S ribosomal protein S12 methylthiotransferase RimO [Merdimmobilis hominis]PWL61476.1 MAG: 30S ribosomal protein S12 methylthiotransferase RimO [Oscillospiraceae bacterium]
MAYKVGMVSLGCSKNQVDAEIMLALIQENGFELCADAEQCDVVIINTCGFIEDAKKESIETILEFCQMKAEGKIKVVVVTGCLAERYQKEVALEIPEADVVLGIGCNGEIVKAIKQALAGERVVSFADKTLMPLSGNRVLANAPFFAYVKLADGCNNRCAFCAIPLIRGDFRSRPMEDVLDEVKRLAAQGVKEVNVVAQDTTRYGDDLYGRLVLPELLREICKIDGIRWVRILYCYPDRITDELLEVMAQEEKIVKYVDVPIQHASGEVLRAMNRKGNADTLKALLQKIRDKVPGVVLRTTMIVGFPGETEEQFEELCNFIHEVKFERLGCFTYSREEDTPAAEMADQIDPEVMQRRAEVLMTEQLSIAEEINKTFVGKTFTVMVEDMDEESGLYYGRSYMDAPDIDTKVYFSSEEDLCPGDFVEVVIENFVEYDLVGHIKE